MCNCFGTYISSHTIVNLKNKTLWSITKFFALGQNSKSCFNISMQLRLGPSPSLPLSYFLSLSLSFTPSHCAFLSLSFLLRSSLIYSLLMPLSHSLSCFLSLSLPLSHLLPYSLAPPLSFSLFNAFLSLREWSPHVSRRWLCMLQRTQLHLAAF